MAHFVTSHYVPCNNSIALFKKNFRPHSCITAKNPFFFTLFKMTHIGPFFVEQETRMAVQVRQSAFLFKTMHAFSRQQTRTAYE